MDEITLKILEGIGVAALLWVLYKILTPDPREELPAHISRENLSPGQPELDVALASNLNAPVVRGNHLELLTNGDEIFPPMLRAIDSAAESVNFLTFIYWQGEIARQFADALSRAARRGVQVRVLLDFVGSRPIRSEWVDRMRDAGCRVAWFHPVQWYALRRMNNRTHRKVLVVDGKVGFSGGVGIAEEWTGNAQDPEHWRDDHYAVRGPVVRQIQGSFTENWRQATGEILAGPEMFPEIPEAGSSSVVPLLGTPRGSISRISFAYWIALHTAARRVTITTPYFVPNRPMKKALMAAARRGIEVILLIPGKHNDREVVRWAAQSFYSELLEAGVRIFEYEPTMLHVKRITADGAWALVGSANYDNRSLNLNYEIALAVSDREFCRQLDEALESDLERSREVTREEADTLPLLAKLRNHLVLALRQQL
jgi:cardiolipin synthase